MRCAVIGAGSWGSALAIQLARSGDEVWMWARTSEAASGIQTHRENKRYLPGISMPKELVCSSDLETVLSGAQVVLCVVPSQMLRDVMTKAAPFIDEGAVV